ncbi:MAG TPA: serine/threonine-protein kinase [Ktedonobacteraceae bacterium]|nr:serine/threonine-protein kinase [Ktedonobacteraceae bacterium]
MAEGDRNIGRLIGNYRVLAEVGAGGFGKVYRGEHIYLTERSVAIKFLHTHLSSTVEREQFLQEAYFLEKLKHPHMLQVFDVGIDDGFPYLVTEYAPQGSLRNRIKNCAPNFLPIEEVIEILSQIGQPLYYAHQQQTIHRDLKPENILFNAKGEALLSDFGIATTLSTASVKTVGLIGTPLYMAPEQFQGIISKESDQYALGCITYELVTGQVPFNAPDFFALGFRHLSATPVPPRQINPNLPVHVEQAILKALAKQRNERHSDVRAFINALSTSAHYQVSTRPGTSLSVLPQGSTLIVEEAATAVRTTDSPGTTQQSKALLSREDTTDDTLIASYNQAQSPRYQAPVTPLPTVVQTPSAEQQPVTFLPSTNGSASFAGDEYPTLITAPGINEDVREVANAGSNAGEYVALASSFITPPSGRNKHQSIFKSKRALFIFAAACILLIASMMGTLVFALPSTASQSGKTKATTGTTIGQTTHPTQQSTQAGPNHQSTTTPGLVTSPTSGPTATSTTGNKPTQVPTSPHSTVTPKPDPGPVTETLNVPFTSSAVATVHSYNGSVTISVSGTGQASKTQESDAFYVYTNRYGTPNVPYHPTCWVLNINGQDTTAFISLPPYNPSHAYTFQINVPAGQLTFNVCDGDHTDNTGSYSITVKQN